MRWLAAGVVPVALRCGGPPAPIDTGEPTGLADLPGAWAPVTGTADAEIATRAPSATPGLCDLDGDGAIAEPVRVPDAVDVTAHRGSHLLATLRDGTQAWVGLDGAALALGAGGHAGVSPRCQALAWVGDDGRGWVQVAGVRVPAIDAPGPLVVGDVDDVVDVDGHGAVEVRVAYGEPVRAVVVRVGMTDVAVRHEPEVARPAPEPQPVGCREARLSPSGHTVAAACHGEVWVLPTAGP